jgi:rubrerythrin
MKEVDMDAFKAADVYEVAMQIEENGEKLSRHATGLTDDAKMRDVFNYLADEEVKHRKTFEGMVSKVGHYKPPESYPGEYCSYVRAYADGIVFPADRMEQELTKIESLADAVEFGIQREIESILYYLESKNFVPETQQEDIDKIIEEERRHYLRLIDLKRELG